MSEASKALLPSLPQDPSNSVQTLVQVLQRGAKRDPDKVVAGRVEEVSMVRRVDVEEDPWDDDRLFLQKLFEESLWCKRMLAFGSPTHPLLGRE